MNNQNILNNRGTKLDAVLDTSEYYDFELAEIIFGEIDMVLDYSEIYDFIVDNSTVECNINESFVITGKFIITEDNYAIITENNYIIEYV